MSKDSDSTQVVKNEPPAWMRPYIEGGLSASQQLYNQGGPQQYPGSTVVPFSPQTEAAQRLTEQRATAGSPVTGAAQNYTQNLLQGNYLNQNPWLDQTFNRAAEATRGQLDTQFASSGRDLVSQYPYRMQQLNDLATNIYGGDYQQERSRMQSALPFVPSLANQDYVDLAALQGVGGQVEQKAGEMQQDAQSRWNFNQMRPENALNSYLSRIAFSPQLTGSQQTSPVYQNTAGNALGGAIGGAGLGSMLGAGALWPFALGGGLLGLLG